MAVRQRQARQAEQRAQELAEAKAAKARKLAEAAQLLVAKLGRNTYAVKDSATSSGQHAAVFVHGGRAEVEAALVHGPLPDKSYTVVSLSNSITVA